MKVSKTYRSFITTINNNKGEYNFDLLVVEAALEIKIKQADKTQDISVTMRSPGEDNELAVGFLFAEGIIQKASDIINISKTHENTIVVELIPELSINPKKFERNFVSSASCGLCGKSSMDSIANVQSNLKEPNNKIGIDIIKSLPKKLNKYQETFNLTGGLHAVALFDNNGEMLFMKEDVGRHNALDKVIGKSLLDGLIPLHSNIILLSGRVGYELIQKTLAASCPILTAIGAPTSLSASMASKNNLTLVGFLKKHKFNIYSHNKRIEHQIES